MKTIAFLCSTLPVLVICLLAYIVEGAGFVTSLDRSYLKARMANTQIPATGNTVFVAFDSKSLEAIGVWPWPRSVHAELLDNLTAAGASDIFFDIDFAFATEAAEDIALLQALERAGGATLLPVFVQSSGVGLQNADNLSQNRPLELFESQSWPALVNVVPDDDGKIRHYPLGKFLEGEYLPSAASLIAGVFLQSEQEYLINFSISPNSIPSVSAVDVLTGRVSENLFSGRSVVVGAHAIELRDSFAVPVHGAVSGSMIHILAAETLSQQIVPQKISAFVVTILLFATLSFFQIRKLHTRPWVLVAAIFGTVATTELAGLALYSGFALVLPSAIVLPTLLVYALWRLAKSLKISTWLVRDKQDLIDNTQHILKQVVNDSSDAIIVIDAYGRILTNSAIALNVLFKPDAKDFVLPEELMVAAQSAIQELQTKRWRKKPLVDLIIDQNGQNLILQYTVTPSRLVSQNHPQKLREDDNYIATISARDVTQLRRQAEHLDYLSKHDDRTGALRRNELLNLLDAHLKFGNGASVFAINLHRFKTINVTLGRSIGDELLKSFVERLQSLQLGLSPVARLDGDSFAFFTSDCIDEEMAECLAGTIARIMGQKYHLGETTAQIGLRIGYVCHGQPHNAFAQELLSHAESALDEARRSAGTQIRSFDPTGSKIHTRAKAIESAMWDAIDQQEFHLLYQPQVRINDGELFGVEALLRWESQTLGPIFPDEFIEIAESNGFIIQLGRWVLDQSCKDAMSLPADISLAVNVSATQMWNSDIRNDVENALTNSGLEPSRLCLELTESVFVSRSEEIVETMKQLRLFGTTWALDDFGTGYSSLGYLSKLPLEKIKLDKQFSQTLGEDPSSLAIVRSVIQLCDGIGVTLLCEGIETEKHAERLLAEGCIEGQGYLFGKPMTLKDLVTKFELSSPSVSSSYISGHAKKQTQN